MPGDNHLRIHVNADGVVEFSVALDHTVDPSILANMVAAVRRGIVNDVRHAPPLIDQPHHQSSTHFQHQPHHPHHQHQPQQQYQSRFDNPDIVRRTKDDVDLRQYRQPASQHHNLALTKAKSTASHNPHPNIPFLNNHNQPLHHQSVSFAPPHHRSASPVVEQPARNLTVRQIAAEFEEGLYQSQPTVPRSSSPVLPTRHEHAQQTDSSPKQQSQPKEDPSLYDNVREFSSSPAVSLHLNNPSVSAIDKDAKLRPQRSGHSLAPLVSASLIPQRPVQRLAFANPSKSPRFELDHFLPASLSSYPVSSAQSSHSASHPPGDHSAVYDEEHEPDLPNTSFVRVPSHSRPNPLPHPHTLADHEDHVQPHDPLPADTHNYSESRVTDPIVDDATVAAASTISSRSSGLPHLGRVTSRSASLQHLQSPPILTTSAFPHHASSQSVGDTSTAPSAPVPPLVRRPSKRAQDDLRLPQNELADVTSRVTGRPTHSNNDYIEYDDFHLDNQPTNLPDDEAALPVQETILTVDDEPVEEDMLPTEIESEQRQPSDRDADPVDIIAASSPSESPSVSSALLLTGSALNVGNNAGDAIVAEDDEPVNERVRRVTEIPFVAPRDVEEVPDGDENWDSVEYVVSEEFQQRGFSHAVDRDPPPAGADIHAGSMTRVARWRLLSSIGSRVIVRRRPGGDAVEDIHQGTLAEGSPVYTDEKSSSAAKMARRYIPLLFTRNSVKNGSTWCEFSSPLSVEEMLTEIGRISKSLGYQVWRRQGENKLRCIRRLSHRHEMHMIIVVGTISLPEGPLTTVKLRRARSDRNRTDPWRYVHFNRELIERLQRKGIEICGGE